MEKNERYVAPACGAAEDYRRRIVDIVDNIEDEVFLRRIYAVLRKHIEKRGS